MKKIIALLIALSMALSIFAFTGCDDGTDKSGAGNIPDITAPDDTEKDDGPEITLPDDTEKGDGPEITVPDENNEEPAESDADRRTAVMRANYAEVTKEEFDEILENIDAEKLFAEEVTGFGMKSSVFNGFAFGTAVSMSVEGDLQLKAAFGESGLAGVGKSTLKLDTVIDKIKSSYSLSAISYLDSKYAYASIGGKYTFDIFGLNHTDSVSVKAKLNWFNIFDYFFGGKPSDEENVQPVTKKGRVYDGGAGVEFGFNLFNFLSLACDLGFKVYADASDGLKLKLSASANTVWGVFDLLAQAMSGTFSPDKIKQAFAVNTFQFDFYLSIDGNGLFDKAYIEEETSMTIDSSLLDSIPGFNTAPFYTAKTKSSTEIYFHHDKVTVPDNIADDRSYSDKSDKVFGFIKGTAAILGWQPKESY